MLEKTLKTLKIFYFVYQEATHKLLQHLNRKRENNVNLLNVRLIYTQFVEYYVLLDHSKSV